MQFALNRAGNHGFRNAILVGSWGQSGFLLVATVGNDYVHGKSVRNEVNETFHRQQAV